MTTAIMMTVADVTAVVLRHVFDSKRSTFCLAAIPFVMFDLKVKLLTCGRILSAAKLAVLCLLLMLQSLH